jgi:hypothetical protein
MCQGRARPVHAGDAGFVEGHRLVERPARRLDDAAFRLIANTYKLMVSVQH